MNPVIQFFRELSALTGCLLFSAFLLFVAFCYTLYSPSLDLSDVANKSGSINSDKIEVGGVLRPRNDVQELSRKANRPSDLRPQNANPSIRRQVDGIVSGPSRLNYGQTPILTVDENPAVANIVKVHSSDDPKAIAMASFLFTDIPAFDAQEYDSDPTAYLTEVVPSRVWQAAQPGEGVPRLERTTSYTQTIVQGESVRLRVKAVASAPVTFTSFDLGQFQNQLGSVTVAADNLGIATAEFTGSPGTINDVRIIAGSPLASGNQEFVVTVVPTAP